MPTHYIAVIEKEPDSAVGVWFPDVEGCFSAGETVEGAVANAAVALRQHVEAIESAGGRVAPARPHIGGQPEIAASGEPPRQ